MVTKVVEKDVVEKLKRILDPHTKQNVWEMGLIEDLKLEGDRVKLTFRPSSPFCPIGKQLAFAVKRAIEDLGVKAEVRVTGYINEKELNEELCK